MPHCEAIADFDFLAIFATDAKEGADYALLVGVTAKGVVEDGEDSLFPTYKIIAWRIWAATYLRLYYHIQRRCCWLRSYCRWAQRPSKMEKRVSVHHVGQHVLLCRKKTLPLLLTMDDLANDSP